MKNKYLLLTFLIFSIGFLATQFYFEKQPRTLQTTLIQIDTDQITSLLIYPAVDNQKEYLLKKEDGFWLVHRDDVTLRVKAENAKSFLENLANIKTNGVVARKSEDWKNYEVGMENATLVKVFAGKNLLDEFYVNQFNKKKSGNSKTSYIRLLTSGEVFEVTGALCQLFCKSFNDYRNTNILTTQTNTIEQISISTPQNKLTVLNKENGVWSQDGLPVDSITLDNYLTSLATIQSNDFLDDFDLVESNHLIYKTLTIKGQHIKDPIIITAYLDSTRTLPFIIQSNQNESSFFTSGENGIFEQIFGGW